MRVHQFSLEHVYREFNADAYAVANEALDATSVHQRLDGIIIAENWHRTAFSGQLLDSLYLPGLGGLDVEDGSAMIDPTSYVGREESSPEASDAGLSSDADGDAFMIFQLSQWD